MQPQRWLSLVLLLVSLAPAAQSAPAPCHIVEGVGIGGIRLGVAAQTALALTGAPLSQHVTGSQVQYALRPPWSQMVAQLGVVQRVSTRSPQCLTSRGIGPGATEAALRTAYASASVSVTTPVPDGDVVSFPFVGVRFLVREERVQEIEVFAPETLGSRPQPTSAPSSPGDPSAPSAAGSGWVIRSATFRVDGSTLIVTGTVENRRAAVTAYAEVCALNAAGMLVGQDSAPLHPNPVPLGSIAAFEVRVAIEEVVRRYIVAVRPSDARATLLAQYTGEIRSARPFSAIIARNVQSQVQADRVPSARTDFVLAIGNGSAFTLAKVTVYLEIEAVCGTTMRTSVKGSATVGPVGPGASARFPFALPNEPRCPVLYDWTAKARVTDVEIDD